MDRDNCIDICNQLLRGEISAVETYSQAIEKIKSDPNVEKLLRIRHDHEMNVQKLTDNVLSMGGEPDRDSGSWGAFAKFIEAGAKIFGEESALQALIEGEEHGIREYEEALSDDDVMNSCKNLIRQELLPRQQEHVAELKSITSQVQ